MKFEVEELKPVLIRGNFDEMQAALTNMMTAYAGLEVNEDNIPERKKDIATLRKIKAAIEDKRKATKKEYEKPLKAFEAECKKLTGVIDTEIDRINSDLAVFEQKRIAEKRAAVWAIYQEVMGDKAEYLPIENIRRKEWDNKTCSENEIRSDIQQAKISLENDLEVLKNTCGEFYEDCIKVYKSRGLMAALQRMNDLKEARQTIINAIPKTAPVKNAWTFTVFKSEDAASVKAYLEMFGIDYKED